MKFGTSENFVSTHSRPKAAGKHACLGLYGHRVSTHSRPKAAGVVCTYKHKPKTVSTHSRPKAAGPTFCELLTAIRCFNTQPPEGGWVLQYRFPLQTAMVSTHSRPKAAGQSGSPSPLPKGVSTHSRPKAAG